MSYQKIEVCREREGQVIEIILNSPSGNVLDREMIGELIEVVGTEGREREVKAIVFRARGKNFSFGASVEEHQMDLVGEMLPQFHRLFRTLVEVSRPCLALVQGACLGGGLELALFCHWIFAAEGATFSQPEIDLAVFPPMASLILPMLVGQRVADDLVLTGRKIEAREACEMGLIHSHSTEPDKEMYQFLEEHLLPKSAKALEIGVKASRWEFHRTLLSGINELERLYLEDLMATRDANEGIGAFLEKRNPEWTNR